MCDISWSTDILTVSETATEPPQEETGINSPRNLGLEATFVNHNFSQQVLKTVSFYSNKYNSSYIGWEISLDIIF